MNTVYSHTENHPVTKIVLFKAIIDKTQTIEDAVFEKTNVEYIFPEKNHFMDRNNITIDPAIEYPTNQEEYLSDDTTILFKLVAFNGDTALDIQSDIIEYNNEFGKVTLTGSFIEDSEILENLVYDENCIKTFCIANFEKNNLAENIILEIANKLDDEGNPIFSATNISHKVYDNYKSRIDEEVRIPDEETSEGELNYDKYILNNLNSEIICRYSAVNIAGEIIASSEPFKFKPEVSKDFIIDEKDDITGTCTLVMYIGDGSIEKVPKRVIDPIDTNDTKIYKPTIIECTCFNYSNINNIEIGTNIIEIR